MQSFIIQSKYLPDMTLLPHKETHTHVKLEEPHPHTPIQHSQGTCSSGLNRSRTWSKDELYRVAAFLYHNADKFSSDSLKKQHRIYKVMSGFIHTRNVNQCRSYTNKLLKGFGNLEKINAYFRESLPEYGRVVREMKEAAMSGHADGDAQGEDSIVGTQQSLEKSIPETDPFSRQEMLFSHQYSPRVIIPSFEKCTPTDNPFHYPLRMQQYTPNREPCEYWRTQCLQWALLPLFPLPN